MYNSITSLHYHIIIIGVDAEIQPSLEIYDDGYHYQNIIAPLINLEAEYDRKIKDAQKQEGVSVRWESGLSKRKIAVFRFPGRDESETRLVLGDELKLSLGPTSARQYGKPWEAVGSVLRIDESEIELTMRSNDVPAEIQDGYVVEFVWKSVSYDRMQNALKTFAVDELRLLKQPLTRG